MTCKFCKKLTDENSGVCEICEAKSKARSCAEVIMGAMSKHRDHAKDREIFNPQAFLQSKLDIQRNHWKKYYTEKVNIKEYPEWYNAFDKEVDRLTDYLTSLKEDSKKRDVSY